MLFNTNLENIIFERGMLDEYADEFIIITGYIGAAPVERLHELGTLNTTVIYGMYASDGISNRLHSTLRQLQDQLGHVNIVYSQFPVHSKSYIWKQNGEIIYALVGSANFSANGLRTDYRELLTVVDKSAYESLSNYIDLILNSAISCLDIDVLIHRPTPQEADEDLPEYCRMTLLKPSGEIHDAHGLNWGQNLDNHTNPRDASIPIRVSHIRNYPHLFPPKQDAPQRTDGGRQQRQNDAIELVWDDGRIMEGLLEGSQPVDGLNYPKQIASFPTKHILGDYIRQRLGLSPGDFVHTEDLYRYGRTHVDVSLIGENVYYMDFSVPPANE
jgi:hypothetical protein